MRKSYMWMTAGVIAISVAMQAGAVQAETLADALVSAYKASNLMAQNEATLRAADEGYAVQVSALRPVVTFISQAGLTPLYQGYWSHSLSDMLQLSAQLTVYDFGRGKANKAVAQQTVLATEEGLKQVEQQVLYAAAKAYVDVTLQTEMVAMQQSNVTLVGEDLKAAKDKFDVGEVTMTDVSQAEAQLGSAMAQLAAAKGQLTLAREAFKAAVGSYPGALAPLPSAPNLPKTLAEARSIAAVTNPTIKQYKYQVAVADAQVALAAANMRPDVTGSASVSNTFYYQSVPQGVTGSVGLKLSQTIYQGGQLSALYRKALDSQDSARAQLSQQALTVAQNVGNSWSGIQVARASITAGDKQIVAAQAALDGTKQEAAVGSRTTLDVLNAEQVLLNAKAARLQAVANLYSGQYGLLEAMGLMTVKYLKLGIPTYDPKAYYNAVKTAPATSTRGARLDKILKLMGRN